MRIDFKGYDKPVKALVPLKNEPIEFYKWWLKNTDKLHLSLKDKIQLFDKINIIKPQILKSEHKKLINK